MSTETHTYRSSPRRLVAAGARILLPCSSSSPGEGLRRLDAWAKFPYRSVEVLLKDGSFFRMSTESVAHIASEVLFTATKCSAQAHLHRQIVPAVCEKPELLLEIAAQLPWSAIRQLARQALWKTPPVLMCQQARDGARMVLSTCSA